MSDFLRQALEANGELTPKEEVVEEQVNEQTSTELVEEQPAIETAEEVTTNELVEEPVKEDVVPEKIKVNYNEWLTQHEQTISKYLTEKNTDYKSLDPEKLAELKFRKDNPNLTEEDIREELADKYGIGLSKMSEDLDDYEDELELKEAKEHNKNLAKLQRELKKAAPKFAEEFEQNKYSIELPDFEIDIPKQQYKTQEDIYDEIIQQTETYRQEQWIPELKKSVDSFESIKQQIEYEDNGNKVVLDVDYKLSDADKQEIIDEYGDYIVTAKDQEKYQDLDGFLKDKAPAKVMSKLLKTVAKEAAARARESFVKNELLNYDDGKQQYTPQTGELSFAEKVFAAKRTNRG